MSASMLEAMEMYQPSAAGEQVEKLDVREVLDRTAKSFFEKLSTTRRKRVAAHLEKDPLAGSEEDHDRADAVAFSLKNRVVVITGASRGIGEAIAVRFAGQGASVVILSQTTKENPALPGTVQSAVKACVDAGGDAIAIKTDISDEGQIQAAIRDAMNHYGGVIDVLVNCASVHFPQRSADIDVRRFDALNNVNVKGTILVSSACAPFLRNSKNPHVLTIAPAPRADADWLAPHAAYSASKIAMGFVTRKLHAELGAKNVACNTLWPRYAVATAATNFIGGERLVNMSRTPAAMADAAFRIVASPSRKVQNVNFIENDVLRGVGVEDFAPYNVDEDVVEPVDDFFLWSSEHALPRYGVWHGEGGGFGKTRNSDPTRSKREVVLVLVDDFDLIRRGEAILERLSENRPDRKIVFVSHFFPRPGARTEDSDASDGTTARRDGPRWFRDAAVSDERVKNVKFLRGSLHDALIVQSLVEKASLAFYGIDAVLDLLVNRPRLEWESACLTDATSISYARHFDVPVRAAFLAIREALPHLSKSGGPRRVISVAPPPLCSVLDAEPRGVVAVARVVKGLHVKGIAAELRDVKPPISVVGVWSEEGPEVSEVSDTFFESATRAIAILLVADAKSVPSGSFWRAEDVTASRGDRDEAGGSPKTAERTCIDAPSPEPAYADSSFEFPDIAEELAEELERMNKQNPQRIPACDDEWQLV